MIIKNFIDLFIWLPAASIVRQGDENVSEVSDGRVMPHGDNPFMVHVFNLRVRRTKPDGRELKM